VIINPSFEGEFYKHSNRGNMQVAVGWQYYVASPHLHPWVDNGEYKEPELNPEITTVGKGRVRSGKSAQKMHNTYSICRAGFFQDVPVVEGRWYEFAVWLYVWCSKGDDPDISKGGRYHARAAANPWGAGLHDYHTVFGREPENKHYNSWYHSFVVFQAWSETARVGIEGMPEHPVKHNDLYIDDASFQEVWLADSSTGQLPDPQPDTGDYADILARLDKLQSSVDHLSVDSYTLEIKRIP
jgi:hypothetical protein